MPKRKLQAIHSGMTVSILLLSILQLALAPSVPYLILTASPRLQLVPAGGSVTFTLNATGYEGYEGPLNLTVVNPPSYITAKFKNNPMGLWAYSSNTTDLVIQVAQDASVGYVNLTVMAVHIISKGESGNPKPGIVYAALNIVESLQTTTITITNTIIITTTTIQLTTVTTKEQIADIESWRYVALGLGIAVAGIAVALIRIRRR